MSFFGQEESSHLEWDTLGGRIVYARETQELTTPQLAAQLGVDSETVAGWENDRSEPQTELLVVLAGMLNVSPTWLKTGEGESPVNVLTDEEMQEICSTVERLRAQASAIAHELEQLEQRLQSYDNFAEKN